MMFRYSFLAVLCLVLCAGSWATPHLTGVGPTRGFTTGHQMVTISGWGFMVGGGTRVLFGNVDGTDVWFQDLGYDGAALTCETPAHDAGVVDVTVINPDTSSATLPNAFTFYVPVPPNPTGISPATGPANGGTPVTITGTDFQMQIYYNHPIVYFGEMMITAVTFVDSHTLTCMTPTHDPGPVDVIVRNPDSLTGTLTGGFTFTAPIAVHVDSISPVIGYTGGSCEVWPCDNFTMQGTGFYASTSTTVYFGDAATSAYAYDNGHGGQTLTGPYPAHAAGVVDVRVENPTSSFTLPHAFTYEYAPVIDSFTPAGCAINEQIQVTITGSHFVTSGTTHVKFGDAEGVNVQVQDAGHITCSTPTPPLPLQDRLITVVNPDGLYGMSGHTTFYFAQHVTPQLTYATPDEASTAGGTFVQVYGTGFSPYGPVHVLFGGVDATSVAVASGSGINYVACHVPPHVSGTVAVTVINPFGESGTLANAFTYVRPAEARFKATVVSTTAPFEVDFTDVSVPGDHVANRWWWAFGDNSYSGLRNPVHTYATAGVYTVRFTVMDDVTQDMNSGNLAVGVQLPAVAPVGVAACVLGIVAAFAAARNRRKRQ